MASNNLAHNYMARYYAPQFDCTLFNSEPDLKLYLDDRQFQLQHGLVKVSNAGLSKFSTIGAVTTALDTGKLRHWQLSVR